MRHFAFQRFATIQQVYDGCGGCDLVEGEDDATVATALDMASDILANLSGLQVMGVGLLTVRPVYLGGCAPRNAPDWTDRFGGLDTIPLPGPDIDVVEILIDGAVIAPSDYGLLNGQYLFRRSAEWPTRNDLRLASTEDGTFEITFRRGAEVDLLTTLAATELACELTRDMRGRPTGLGRGVTQASIQGATVVVADRAKALRDGEEQIPVVARWMSIYAPDGPQMVSDVWAPELRQNWNLVVVSGPSGS